MVKNTTGGNKAKQQGRRFAIAASQAVTSVRKVAEAGEMYAVVSRVFGGKFCQVTCQDGTVRRCSIRKKFMARRRGENNVAVGVWVLVGLYDWEVRADGSQTCDLLEVYSPAEKDRLRQVEKTCNFACMLQVGDEADQETVAFSEYHTAAKEDDNNIKKKRTGDGNAVADEDEDDDEDDDDVPLQKMKDLALNNIEDDDSDDSDDDDNNSVVKESLFVDKRNLPAASKATEWINVDDI